MRAHLRQDLIDLVCLDSGSLVLRSTASMITRGATDERGEVATRVQESASPSAAARSTAVLCTRVPHGDR